MTGAKGVTGPLEAQNSYRSELAGILYSLITLQQICSLGQITGTLITIHYDGLSVISSILNSSFDHNSTKTNFDIINSIQKIRQALPNSTAFAHVSGYQDRGTAYLKLSKLAQLNVQADHLAKTKAKQIQTETIHLAFTSLPYSPCDVILHTKNEGKIHICSNLIDSIRSYITNDDLRNYWITKKNLNDTSHQIDWSLRYKSLSNYKQR